MSFQEADDGASNSDEELVAACRREASLLEREKTAVSLADFYAPTPDPNTRMCTCYNVGVILNPCFTP